MANWKSVILTDKGKTLQAKVEAGKTKLELTKIKLGDGELNNSQTLEGLSELINPMQVIGITTITAEDSICKLTGIVTNFDLSIGYYLRELGVFAMDPDAGEILYAITTDDTPDYLQTKGDAAVVSQEFNISILSSNTSQVTAKIDAAGLLTVGSATTLIRQIVSDHNNDTDAHETGIAGNAASATCDKDGNDIRKTYVKKSGDTMTGQLIAEGGVKGDLAGTADKAIADKNGNAIDETYLPLKGGTLSGDLLIDDSAEHHVKGNNNRIGFYWNGHNFGAFDWDPQITKGIWSYNQSSRTMEINADGGLNLATKATFNSNIFVGDGTENFIRGYNSTVGFRFLSDSVSLVDYTAGTEIWKYIKGKKRLMLNSNITVNAGMDYYVNPTIYGGGGRPAALNLYGTDGNGNTLPGSPQTALMLDNTNGELHIKDQFGGTNAYRLIHALGLAVEGAHEHRFGVQDSDGYLSLWDQTAGRQSDIRVRQLWLNASVGGDNIIFPGGVDTDAPFTDNAANLVIQAWQTLGFRSILDGVIKAYINCRTGDINTKGSIRASNGFYGTASAANDVVDGYLNDGAALPVSAFRSTLFGTADNGFHAKPFRCKDAVGGTYGAGFAWGANDTHGYLHAQYGGGRAFIGAGSHENILWQKEVAWRSDLNTMKGNTPPVMTPLIDWNAMASANGGTSCKNLVNAGTGVTAYGGDSAALNNGDIILNQSYQNFDAILVFYTDDSSDINNTAKFEKWELDMCSNYGFRFNLTKNPSQYWYIYGNANRGTTAHNLSTFTRFACNSQNCGIIEIYGLTY